MPEQSGGGEQERSSTAVTLTTGGLTLLSVLLSIGVTVGVSVSPWWGGLLAGVGTTIGLGILIKVSTRIGRGPLATLANWMITR